MIREEGAASGEVGARLLGLRECFAVDVSSLAHPVGRSNAAASRLPQIDVRVPHLQVGAVL